jgi:bacterioferritin-associated ferredoxin
MVRLALSGGRDSKPGGAVFVCICHVVTEDELGAAIDDGAHTVAAVSEATKAGASCHSCHDRIEDLIEERCGTCPLANMRVA